MAVFAAAAEVFAVPQLPHARRRIHMIASASAKKSNKINTEIRFLTSEAFFIRILWLAIPLLAAAAAIAACPLPPRCDLFGYALLG
jgi:hypothetical protein